MYIVGIVAEDSDSEIVKNELEQYFENLSVININKKTLDNIRNIKFSVIIINKEIPEYNESEKFNNILKNTKYILLNSDIKIINQTKYNYKNSIITFGLNNKSTITLSSISDEMILVSVQRDIMDIKGKIIEVQDIKKEYKYINEKGKNKIYLSLILVTIKLILYNSK